MINNKKFLKILCLKLMWENYHRKGDPYKKFQMLEDIILVQPYLSYYDATKLICNNNNNEKITTK
jgi:hypothetical protein